MSISREQALKERLLDIDIVTLEDVKVYIEVVHPPLPGQIQQSLDTFITEADLASFRWLYSWWAPVEVKPKNLPVPAIAHYCWAVNHTPDNPPVSFDAQMRKFYELALAYCKEVNLNPTHPSESKEDRTRRLNRERMANARGLRLSPARLETTDPIIVEQVRSLEARLLAIKQMGKDQDAELLLQVKQYQDAMVTASTLRKSAAADCKAAMEEVRAEIRKLTAKQ